LPADVYAHCTAHWVAFIATKHRPHLSALQSSFISAEYQT